jgi:hypothetical protein
MDITLREYMDLADETQNILSKAGILLSNAKLEEKIIQIHTGIKNIQAIAKYMADIANIANQFLLSRKKKISDDKCINTYPSENDHAVLRTVYQNKQDSKIIINDDDPISLPVKIVNKITEIPISHIYYVKSHKQYAINIEGLVIKGNLSNIVNYQCANSARCEYGVDCKIFLKNDKKNPCKYYHEPEDYIKLGWIVPDNITRNFTIGSWLYSKTKTPKTYFTRHIGSKDMLKHDLHTMRKLQYREEISNREGQLIHDLLIYSILHNKGFLEKYPHWF